VAIKTIVIHVNDEEVQVELKSARKMDGIWRAELMAKAAIMPPEDKTSMVAFYLYPSCVAAVKSPQAIRDMTLDDFISTVDEADIDLWLQEAYDLNPQWKANMRMLAEMGEGEQKKLGTPSNGLEKLMEENQTEQAASQNLTS